MKKSQPAHLRQLRQQQQRNNRKRQQHRLLIKRQHLMRQQRLTILRHLQDVSEQTNQPS